MRDRKPENHRHRPTGTDARRLVEHFRPSRWRAWRRVGASLLALAVQSNPHRAGQVAPLCTALGAALVKRDQRAAKAAIRALVYFADLVDDRTRFALTVAGAAALEATP